MKKLPLMSMLCCLVTMAEAPPATTQHPGFSLLDKVCVVVEGEDPILLSEIKKRVQQRGEPFADAEKEIIKERLLWVYAKKQMKYDIASVFKAADEHIGRVRESNHLSPEQFAEVLMRPPYSMTLRQFKLETATEYLKNNIKQTIANQITVSDDQVREEAAGLFDVVVISVRSRTDQKISKNKAVKARSLTAEFKKANTIRAQIQPTTSVNDVKNLYSKEANISIIGPIAYEKDLLKKSYDVRLNSEPSAMVIGPFEDDGSETVIWKIKRSKKNLDETALEKLRKESYHNAVLREFSAITDALMNNSTVIVKGCGKL